MARDEVVGSKEWMQLGVPHQRPGLSHLQNGYIISIISIRTHDFLQVGPPPPDQDILYASPKRLSWMAGKRRPPRPSRTGASA